MSPKTRFVAWRLYAAVGKEGIAGLLLLIAAAVVALQATTLTERIDAHRTALERQSGQPAAARLTPVALQTDGVPTPLPRRSEIPGLLADLARLASVARVDASNARYEYLPGSPSVPAQLEIRLELQTKYGALRPFVAMVSNSMPAVALREFTAKRATPDSDELLAELRFVVVLAEDSK
ncbi:MAG: hypothetical protein ACK50I_02510 [Burkholderiales bacterium]|jgi:hypothetical protein|nr:hypothetical protein [Burkholderiales bacterium]MCZ8323325.1 hypothetical protein [Novosphingobium sp.]